MGVFGITGWRDEGWVETARGPRRLLKAHATEDFRDAWFACSELLDAVGLDGSYSGVVKYWITAEHDHDLASLACAEAEAILPRYRAECEARAAHWRSLADAKVAKEAEARERERQRPARAQAELREIMRTQPWLLQPEQQSEAEKIIAMTPAPGHWFTEKLIRMAKATLKRVEGRLAEPAGEETIDADAVLAGCRHISASDQDRAAMANGEGWSKAATTTGHYLAALDSLTPEQARHGARLLRRHRGQLPPELRTRLRF